MKDYNIVYHDPMDMVFDSIYGTDKKNDIKLYWDTGYLSHPYDCVIRGKFLKIEDNAQVYYNLFNHVILFNEDMEVLTHYIKVNAINKFVKKNCKNLDKWIHDMGDATANSTSMRKSDYEYILDDAAIDLGYCKFDEMDRSHEMEVFSYAYCLMNSDWKHSNQYKEFQSPLPHFVPMSFSEATARIKFYLFLNNRQNEYLDTVINTPEERIAFALEKIANSLERKALSEEANS